MYLFPTYVAQSDIHGLGVFTSCDINEGSVVWAYDPIFDRSFSQFQYESFPEHVQEFIRVHGFHDLHSGYWIIGGDNDLYTNHSFTPNLLLDNTKLFHLTPSLIACTHIRKDTELTQNYLVFDSKMHLRKI